LPSLTVGLLTRIKTKGNPIDRLSVLATELASKVSIEQTREPQFNGGFF